MADIHVLEGNYAEDESGSVRIAFHVPVPGGTAYPADATRVSEVPGIDSSELQQIRDGTLIEVERRVPLHGAESQADAVSRVRAMWHTIAADETQRIARDYRFYGTTLARSA